MPFEPFVGEIMYIAGDTIPHNWMPCDGRILQVADYSALGGLLKKTFGGDGTTTFGLPDLRGRAIMGSDLTSPAYPVGSLGGEEGHVLTVAEIPDHSHSFSVNASVAGTDNSAVPRRGGSIGQSSGNDAGSAFTANVYNTQRDAPIDMAADAVGTTGSDQAHENRQPFTVVTACIAISGIYPS